MLPFISLTANYLTTVLPCNVDRFVPNLQKVLCNLNVILYIFRYLAKRSRSFLKKCFWNLCSFFVKCSDSRPLSQITFDQLQNLWDVVRSRTFAVLAVSQARTPVFPAFPGPYSYEVLEERIADFSSILQTYLSQLQVKEGHTRWGGEDRRQCHEPREIQCSQDESHMSQKSTVSVPQSNPSRDGIQEAFSSRQSRTLPPIGDGYRLKASTLAGYGSSTTQSPSVLPVTGSLSTSEASPNEPEQRPLRMQNILNPSQSDSPGNHNHRRVAAQTSPLTASARYPATTSGQSPSDRSTSSVISSGSTHPSSTGYAPSRGLVSRSPMGRAATIGSVNLPSATIDARSSPFVVSKDYFGQTRFEASSFPEASAGPLRSLTSGPSYPLSSVSAQTPDRQLGGGASQAPASQSDSPSSFSSYSQLSRTSPAPPSNVSATQPLTYLGSSYTAPGETSTLPQITLGPNSSYGPVPSTMGQNTYQLMTMDTDQGPIQVPIDTQAASKMADEKRKRNAKASSRFRQRRKEKEKETSQNIAKLEHQIRDIAEEREFYRLERDYFRGVAYSVPSQVRIGPRPPSPRQRRLAQLANVSLGGAQWQAQEDRGGHGRNTRRRTDAYTTAHSLPQPVNTVAPHSGGYDRPSSYPFPNAEGLVATSSGLPAQGSFPPRTSPYDPAEPPSFERNWTSR